ncbi:MAG: LCP family protein, partial [Eubacteriales bacterium]|nr:LCP family protein [Eubacteriales bacterium]
MAELQNKQIKKTKHFRIVFHIPLLILELALIAAGAVVLAFVVKMTGSVQKVSIDTSNLVINTPVSYATEKRELGYRNIALFGVDARNGDLGAGTRSDTIIVMSINQDGKEISLVSVYRDTYLNLGDDTYNKCNAAYAKGGPEQAINMLNMNLDLDITDYVTVGFAGLIGAIDKLGGVEIDVQEVEIQHLNNYQLT